MSAADLATITVWLCPECGYWRQERSSGRHQATDPADPNGRMVVHELHAAEYVPLAALVRIEQNRLTPEEAQWLANMLVTEGYIGTMPNEGDGRLVAKLERIAGDTGEAT